MKNYFKEKGITLIALVVTIIILMILAGVTVGFAMNGSGLFDKAKLATEKYQNAQKDEEEKIEELTNYIIGERAIGTSRTQLYPTSSDTEGAWANQVNQDYNLSQSYKNFKYLLVEVGVIGSTSSGSNTMLIPTDRIINVDTPEHNANSNASWGCFCAGSSVQMFFKSETIFRKYYDANSGFGVSYIWGLN